MTEGLWQEKCIAHYDEAVISFFKEHFKDEDRKCLIIGGAGFDPRATSIIELLCEILEERLTAYLIKEERPDPEKELIKQADSNLQRIQTFCNNLEVVKVNIFADDGAVVGGRNVIRAISGIDFSHFSDIVIDMSALSIGISFPIVSYAYQKTQEVSDTLNVHLALISNPELDAAIRAESNDKHSQVHGFDLNRLFGDVEKAKLWLPVLSENKEQLFSLIHSGLSPHDTCPILPFPSGDPKKGDRIAYGIYSLAQTEWGGPLQNEWGLDPRNFVYADERRPLDIYRTILRIDDERKSVFEIFGGSTIILSPLSSKIPAIGALMAALERNFPIVYVEALSYNVSWEQIQNISDDSSKKTHVWLRGEAYLNF